MRRVLCLVVLLAVARSAPASAQAIFLDPPNPPVSASTRKIADTVSTLLASAAVGLATWDAAHSDDPKGRLLKLSMREGITVGLSTAVKKAVHRTRPDGSDAQSFFSEHTAITATAICSITDRKIGLGATVLVGAGRVFGWKHFLSDTLTGGLVGSVVGCL